MTPLESKLANFIYLRERRLDDNGNLKVYRLPAGDGGGRFEVAGITERFDSAVVHKLVDLIGKGHYKAAEKLAKEYYIQDTDDAKKWTTIPWLEVFLRDAIFHRGEGGATKMLQIALNTLPRVGIGIKVDGGFGPKTAARLAHALNHTEPQAFLLELRKASEVYEKMIAPPVGNRAKFWRGLLARFDARYEFAKTFV